MSASGDIDMGELEPEFVAVARSYSCQGVTYMAWCEAGVAPA